MRLSAAAFVLTAQRKGRTAISGAKDSWTPNLASTLRATATACALTIVLALALGVTVPAQAQTYTILHNFSGGADGAYPIAGLTTDAAGNLYGTTFYGGCNGLTCGGECTEGCGSVFKLTPKGSAWVFNSLYTFRGGDDGADPAGNVIFGPDGSLYGATANGVPNNGTVYNLKPFPTPCKAAPCPWQQTVLYSFTAGADGAFPYSSLIFDQAGNIYGTADSGGSYGEGVVYQLAPRSGGGYTDSTLHSFSGTDGGYPSAGLIFDNSGNLYGTTVYGGSSGLGTVFELSPSGSAWTEKALYSFQGGSDGRRPVAGVVFDASGNLYGATADDRHGGGDGTVFKLTPSNGGWTYSLVYSFTGTPGCGPVATLAIDGAGNLYGTTPCNGANGAGNVFELAPSDGGWTYRSLYDFTGGSDGGDAQSKVVLDGSGNLYGTALDGGSHGAGVVWEITP